MRLHEGFNCIMKYLVTGAAGFIGFHTAKKLLDSSALVVGIDNLNSYYDVSLKEDRLAILKPYSNFEFQKIDIADREAVSKLFADIQPDVVINLAAQAGVRYSLENPYAYIDSNICGFLNILEGCRYSKVKHLVYASSSSVYGANTKYPFSVKDNVDNPISLYAATKKSNELMAHTYSHLYQIPTTGLRFFTVYGPWGRPDMAPIIFTKSIVEGKPINVFNNGKMKRDFTYIDDIVEGVIRVTSHIPQPNPNWNSCDLVPGTSSASYKLYNIGNNNSVELMKFIEVLERCIGKKAIINMMPLQPGDVEITSADVSDLIADVGFRPDTPIEIGIEKFIQWYKDYYKVVG